VIKRTQPKTVHQEAELEEELNRMGKNLHMSAVYDNSLLEENKSLKLQIIET
jgi:hypothetical protein